MSSVENGIMPAKKGSVRTYQCPLCKLNIRGTKSGIRVKCCSEEHLGEEPIMVELPR